MKTLIILFLLAFILAACGGKPEKTEVTLQVVDSLAIAIDSSTASVSSVCFAFRESGTRYLMYLNKSHNELQFYDIDKAKLSHKLRFASEGPDGVHIAGAARVGKDTFSLNTRSRRLLLFANGQGKIFKRYDLTEIINGRFPVMINANQNSPYPNLQIRHRNLLYPNLDLPYRPKAGETPTVNMILKIDLKTDSIYFGEVKFPELFDKQGNLLPPIYNTPGTTVEDTFVYRFFHSHEIWTTTNHADIKKHIAKSKYMIKEFQQPNTLEKMTSGPKYGAFLFDSYRNVYYSFVFPGVELSTKDNPYDTALHPDKFSIMVLDRNFNVLCETPFEGTRYLMSMAFVEKEGLFLCKNNPKNPDFKEEFLSFDIFQPLPVSE